MENTMKVRRIVTGHDSNGNAIVKIDDTIDSKSYQDPHDSTYDNAAEFALIWTTDTFPSSNVDDTDGGKRTVGLTSPGGTVFRVVDMKPGRSSPMHRTQSLDYGIVLDGEIELELDNGVKVDLKKGDVVVQRGTIHAWNNKTDQICRMAFVLVEAERLNLDGKTLEATH